MRRAFSSIVAILSIASAVFAAEPAAESCSTPKIVSAVLLRHFPLVKLTHIEGADARRFVEAFNSGSASSYWAADEVLIARNPQTPERARIGFFKDGCLLALVPRSLWTVDSLHRSLKIDQNI